VYTGIEFDTDQKYFDFFLVSISILMNQCRFFYNKLLGGKMNTVLNPILVKNMLPFSWYLFQYCNRQNVHFPTNINLVEKWTLVSDSILLFGCYLILTVDGLFPRSCGW